MSTDKDESYWPLEQTPEGWIAKCCPRCLSINLKYDAAVEMISCQDCGEERKEHPEQRR